MSDVAVLFLLPIFLPVLVAVGLARWRPGAASRFWILMLTTTLNLALVTVLITRFYGLQVTVLRIAEGIDLAFRIDHLSQFFALLVSVLWVFTSLYALEYMKHEGRENQFFTFFLASLGITLGIAFASNLLTFYLFYELLTLATYPLVVHNGSEKALASGRNYLLYSFLGASAALFAMILIYQQTHSLEFTPGGLLALQGGQTGLPLAALFILMALGFGVKAAIFPFHSWLPQAMVAPTPVSALLHAVAVVKSGLYAVIRTTYYIFGASVVRETGGQQVLAGLIVISILMGSFLALRQENLKMRLAYSTVSQLGYVLLGLMLLNREALVGSLMHLLSHALIKITLFYCAGAIMYQTHKTDVSQLKGLGQTMPYTMVSFTLASIALVGIPPTKGFVSKWILVRGALESGNALYPAVLLISALLTALYLLPVISNAFFRPAEGLPADGSAPHSQEAPWKMLLPILAISLLTITLGLFPNPVRGFMSLIALEVMP